MAEPVLKPATIPQASWKSSGPAAYLYGRSFVDGVDALARDMERKWGVDRLRLLVDDELRARFDRQRAKFNHAIWHGDLEDVKRESARMQNAWRAVDAAATLAGRAPLAPNVWEVALPNGTAVAIVRDTAEAHAVIAEGRRIDVYTLDEIAHLIAGFPELVKAKASFPGAQVVRVGPITDPLRDMDLDEEIPF